MIADIDLPLDRLDRTVTTTVNRRSPTGPKTGTLLTREYKGQQIRVLVLDDGRFEHDGVVYRSLSAVAKTVTGSHWSGNLFFGLRQRRKAE